jgi:hypothetical protein
VPERLDDFMGASASASAPSSAQGGLERLEDFMGASASASAPSSTQGGLERLEDFMGGGGGTVEQGTLKPSEYFAAHPTMDPLAVQTAFQEMNSGQTLQRGTTPEMAMRQRMQQENAQRGAAGSAGAGVLQNYSGTAGAFQQFVAKGEDALGFNNAAQNTRLAAERSFDFAPSSEHAIAGKVGQIAGGIPMAFAGPAGAIANAANAAGQTSHEIDARRDNGEQISALQGGTDMALQAGLNFLMTRVGQQNLTGPLAPMLVKSQLPTIAKMFGPQVARVIASGILEAGVQGSQQILSNLATKATVDPTQDTLANLPDAAGTGAVFGTLGRTIHEGLEHRAYNTTKETAPSGPVDAREGIQPTQTPVRAGQSSPVPRMRPAEVQTVPATDQIYNQKVGEAQPYQVGGNQPDKGTVHPNASRLPDPPANVRDMSNNQIRQWMTDNGYNAPEKGSGLWSKTRLMTEINRQQTAGVGQHGAPALPQGAEGWDAGQLRGFAAEHGVEIPKAIEDQAAQGQPRKVLFNFIKEATGNVSSDRRLPSLVSHVPAVPESRPNEVPQRAAGEPAGLEAVRPGTEGVAEVPAGRVTKTSRPPVDVAATNKSLEFAGPNRNPIPLAKSGEGEARPQPYEVNGKPAYALKGEEKPATQDEGPYAIRYLPAGAKEVQIDKLHESHQEVLKVAKELTGRDAVPVRGTPWRGAYGDGVMYYNPERAITMASRRETIAHEATHWLQDNKPELVKPIADAIPKAYAEKLGDEYERIYQRQEGKPLSPQMRQKEIEAYAVGKAMSRPAVMRAVMNENPGAFAKFADAVMTKLRSLTAGGRLTNQIIESLRAARKSAGEQVGGEVGKGGEESDNNVLPHSAGDLQNLPQALTGNGSIYKEEIEPRLEKLTHAGMWGFKTLRDLFPMETGAGSKEAANVFRGRFGQAANNLHRAETAFEEARKGFDRAGKDENLDFMRRMYDGAKQATPELQKVADAMYADANAGRQKLAAMGNDAAKSWSDHWFNMMWKKDQGKADLMLSASRPGKIEGQAGFLKKRALGEFEDGLKQGLVPKYDNPVEMFLATKAEREKFIAGYAGMNDMAKAGTIKRISDEAQVPQGWEPVPSGAKGVLRNILKGDGEAYAPKDVNRILKNIVEPSKVGNNPIFRLAMDANNVATQTLLGLSAFHLRKVTQELVNLNMARALDMKIQGQEGAGKALLKSAVSPKDAIAHGGDVQKILLGLKQASPEQARVTDAMIQGGMRAKGDSIYETQFGRKFAKAIRQGGVQGWARAAAYALPAGNEFLMQKGVFNYVQRAKLHLGYELTSDFLKKNPDADTATIRSEVGKISDHLDNVLGLMVRDNLFWNRTARDLATLSTLSVGWNYGSGRALAGGMVDLGKGIGTLAKGGKVSDIDTRRLSYLGTTAALTALTGATITYMATGKAPQSLRDYIFPPAGAKDRNGHDVRLNTGFYTSDWFDFFHDPIGTLKAKGSPIMHEASDLIANRDFKGNKIFDTDEGWRKVAGQIADYLVKANTPLSIAQLRDSIQSGGSEAKSTGLKVAGMLGVRTASKKLSMSDAEIEAQRLIEEQSKIGGRTQEEADKSELVHHLADMLRDKQSGAQGEIRKAVREGKLQPRDVSMIQKRAKEPVGLQGLLHNTELHAPDMMKVWQKMTPAERRQNQWLVRGRIGRSEIPATQKREFFKQIATDVKDAVGK